MKKIFRKLFLLVFIILLVIGGCYIYFFSPKAYSISRSYYENKLVSSSLDGLTIAFISDVHLNQTDGLSRLEEAIDKLNNQPFDIAIFGGDLYDSKVFESKNVSSIFKKIKCKYGKFAVLGDKDKDSSREITQILNNGGFEVISNEVRSFYYKNENFNFLYNSNNKDISELKYDKNKLSICICHEPDSFESNKNKINLQLSGHSLGGSLYIPFYGPLSKTEDAVLYNHGTYTQGNSTLIVSNGFSGTQNAPYKLFAKNEINLITLKSKS